jgi:molecular chaperone GrpE
MDAQPLDDDDAGTAPAANGASRAPDEPASSATPAPAAEAAREPVTTPEPTVPDELPATEPVPAPTPEPTPEPDDDTARRLDELAASIARIEKLVTATPEPPAPDPALGELRAAIEQLDRRVAERDRLAERDRDLGDRLHAENQRLRAGETFAVIAPVARDLIRLRDQALQLDAASSTPGRSDAALIEPQLLQILARLGVERYEPTPGEPFDANRHQGVGRRPTADGALDQAVAEVHRGGFTGPDGRLLRPAEVEVWRHDPALAATTAAAPEAPAEPLAEPSDEPATEVSEPPPAPVSPAPPVEPAPDPVPVNGAGGAAPDEDMSDPYAAENPTPRIPGGE